MKKYLLVAMLALFATGQVYAESAYELCTAEAKDAGIEGKQDFQAYVDECVDQVNAELNAAPENSDKEQMDKIHEAGSSTEES